MLGGIEPNIDASCALTGTSVTLTSEANDATRQLQSLLTATFPIGTSRLSCDLNAVEKNSKRKKFCATKIFSRSTRLNLGLP
jgi:hypothetical protein